MSLLSSFVGLQKCLIEPVPTDSISNNFLSPQLVYVFNQSDHIIIKLSIQIIYLSLKKRTAEKIPLSEVSMSQLIAYDSEKDLMPVMLANCSYSLEVGKETQLQYNWETLEKRIIDRLIRGRSLVHFEVNTVLRTLYRLFVCLFVCIFCLFVCLLSPFFVHLFNSWKA